MLDEAGFAFLVLTGEDLGEAGESRPRENVIHEVGLFQGRLGFNRAIVLQEDGCSTFSNIHGLTVIRFRKDDLFSCSERIRDVLQREGLIA
jgi:predicted nucleotide-binding protein